MKILPSFIHQNIFFAELPSYFFYKMKANGNWAVKLRKWQKYHKNDYLETQIKVLFTEKNLQSPAHDTPINVPTTL